MKEQYEYASTRVEMASDATLRDYLASKAMNGILSNPAMIDTSTDQTLEWVAKNAYQAADAMLKARG
ncbi:hypothetical protein [Providencia alcalifaciens]|uniref:hypothetical protein n=1 Tax=Providencia alcalifaciens TaxID=126385 RepID=UPI0012B5DC0F|nr:hypothetical protein [Providencia alcalifaciens]MTC16563.1 hypothetical protein [Providencia alcalifaciens]